MLKEAPATEPNPPLMPFTEWFSLVSRWIHVIAGIMWIGDSLLFMWIDSHLRPDPEGRGDVEGVTWLIHGGGYYRFEKRLLAPGRLPPVLRWFWLEATATWISGMLLLVLVYYLNADAFLIDRSVSGLTAGEAVVVALGLTVGGWFLYDGVWQSRLRDRPLLAAVISGALFAGASLLATRTLSPRAAFMHVGAMLGTIMVANVWVRILRPQRQMLEAARLGRPVDQTLGLSAKTRSTHNTYLTFPVIFLMLSPHFPAVYTAPLNWLVLILFFMVGAGARHLMLVGPGAARGITLATLAAAAAAVFLIARGAAGVGTVPSGGAVGPAPTFAQVRTIIVQRCTPCHSQVPTMPGFSAPPAGVSFDQPAQIRAMAARIKVRAVQQRTMPPGNRTKMTQDERDVLGRWIDAGVPLR